MKNSTAGYIAEILVLQFRHFPPRMSQLKTGMLSYGAIGFPHFGQLDAGRTMDFSAGMRRMHTFRKLPMTMPNRNDDKRDHLLNLPHVTGGGQRRLLAV